MSCFLIVVAPLVGPAAGRACWGKSLLLGRPLSHHEAYLAVLLDLLLERVALLFAGLLDVVILEALGELVLELFLGDALGGLDAPPVGGDVVG
ncbi:MAG: hypothetical protein KA201_33365, partial [Kofleriaceae bacterium]|nr:hypothetical protein [Kofleriaceae bacterium]